MSERCSGPYTDARDCPIHRKDVPPAAPVPQSGGEAAKGIGAEYFHGAAMHLLFCPKKLENCERCQKIQAVMGEPAPTPDRGAHDPSKPCPTCGTNVNLNDGRLRAYAEEVNGLLTRLNTPDRGAGTSDLLNHGMNCPALNPMNEEDCTCGLKWRIQLQTEREMHNAWRKRAEEAEAALADRGEGVALRTPGEDAWLDEIELINNNRSTGVRDKMRTLLRAYRANLLAAPQPKEAELRTLTFTDFSRINRQRCEAKDGFNHQLNSWSTSDWFLALLGELGEAANIAKKLNRVRDGIPGNKLSKEELETKLRQELGDSYVYLDLLAQSVGVSIGEAAVEVFNAKSDELGCHIRAALATRPAQGEKK